MKPIQHPRFSISDMLTPHAQRQAIAGAVVAMADAHETLSLETVGFADINARAPMRPDSLFWIASMTKPMTGVAIMMLVEQEKISLDDPVDKYLPHFKNQWLSVHSSADCMLLRKPTRTPTIRELMSHTSGMPFTAPNEWPLDELTLTESMRCYALTPLATEPGTKYSYSNMGVNICGRIIELVSGQQYADFMDTHLVGPLGMKDTSFWPSKEQLSRLAKTYTPNQAKDALVETQISQLTRPYDDRAKRTPMPAGGYFSTAADMLRFGQMLLNGGTLAGRTYLSPASMAEISKKQTPDTVTQSYSIGFSMDSDWFGHGGALATELRVSPRHGLAMVYLVQHSGFLHDGNALFGNLWNAAVEKLGKPA